MNIQKLKNNRQHLPKALLCLSGVLALLIGAKVSAFVLNSEQISKDIALALNCTGRSEENVNKFKEMYSQTTEALKNKNLFMVPLPPKKNPVTHVTAILGDKACIADKWYKVGESINDAKVINITPNEVTILWNDHESKLKPFDTVTFEPPQRQTSNERGRYREKVNKREKKPRNEKNFRPDRMAGRQPAERPPFTEEERRKFNRLTPEQRAKWQEMRSRGSRGGDRPRGPRPGKNPRGPSRPRR